MISVSNLIALAALVVSGLSVFYAFHAVREAKKANNIALHAHKVGIYEEVVAFTDCFRGLLNVPSEERLEKFKKQAVQRAEIYLSDEAYRQLEAIYKHCKDNEVWLSIAESEGGGDNKPNSLRVRQEYKSIVNQLNMVVSQIKDEARPTNA